MKSTDRWQPSSEPETRSDRFEELRAAYYARLRSDLVRLTALRVQLDAVSGGDTLVYEEIRRVAHGMAGAAAMFEVAPVASAAARLEEAARSTRRAGDAYTHVGVSTALNGLMLLLQEFGA